MSGPVADALVREATAADATAIGVVQAAAWQTSYRGLLPAETLAALDPVTLADVWRDAIVRPPSGAHRVLVALAAGRVVGYAAVVPHGTAPAVAELAALVVEPAAQGGGHGSRLLNAAVDRLRHEGYEQVTVWVLEQDVPRREFLAGAGFADDGGRRAFVAGTEGSAELRELRMSATVADGP